MKSHHYSHWLVQSRESATWFRTILTNTFGLDRDLYIQYKNKKLCRVTALEWPSHVISNDCFRAHHYNPLRYWMLNITFLSYQMFTFEDRAVKTNNTARITCLEIGFRNNTSKHNRCDVLVKITWWCFHWCKESCTKVSCAVLMKVGFLKAEPDFNTIGSERHDLKGRREIVSILNSMSVSSVLVNTKYIWVKNIPENMKITPQYVETNIGKWYLKLHQGTDSQFIA